MNAVVKVKRNAGLFSNMSVAQRVYMLVFFPLILLLLIGSSSILVLDKNLAALSQLGNRVTLIDSGNKVIRRTQRDYMLLLHQVALGGETWQSGLKKLRSAQTALHDVTVPRYKVAKEIMLQEAYGKTERDKMELAMAEMDKLSELMETGAKLLEEEDRVKLELYVQNDLSPDTTALRDSVHNEVEEDIKQAYASVEEASGNNRRFLILAVALVVGGIALTVLLGFLIYRSIVSQINHLTGTMRDISAGDLNARVSMEGKNELVELGDAFDGMVEDRIATQRKINADHQQLNESVFSLLEAVADLSERNLTVRAKVTEDATGPLADAVNQLAEDTSDVLRQVRDVAAAVEGTAREVNRHTQSVNDLAALGRTEAEETAQQMGNILRRLDSIATSAQQANRVAGTTSQATREAQESVGRTLVSISGIRDTVQETGKRLKRLGERSQEISRIVDIINNISERTTVLALNASMQATAAGEAGRGFSVIAEEIQHLAEGSRESTEQIGVLVRNIQQEANTTISTMDQTISEVVDGSKLAEQAAEQMQVSLDSTIDLVGSVGRIAADSAEQISASQDLRARAERIVASTRATGQELMALTGLTGTMAEYGQRLVKSVNVFKLDN